MMKTFTIICSLLFLAAVYTGCVSDNKTKQTVAVAAPQIVKGDFNGDGKTESIQLIKPTLNKEGTDCPGGCVSYLKFSDTTIKAIRIDTCIAGTPENLGDLNGDGKDEIGLLREWFTSCWRDYNVYTYRNDNWVFAVPPIRTHCNQWDAHVKPIEKDSLNKGYVIVRYSELDNNAIVNKSKIVAIK